MDPVTQEPVDPSADAILEALGDPGELSLDDPQPSPDGDQPTEVQPEPSPDAVPAQASTEPPAEAQDTGTPSPADPDTPESEAPTPEPFAFTADGKRVQIDGATVAGDTITLTREAWQRSVQPHLADRAQFARQRQQLEAALSQKGVREEQSGKLIQMLEGIAGKSDEEVVEWALGLKDKMPLLMKDAEIAALRQRAPEAPAEPEITDEQVGQWLDTSLQTFLDRAQYRDVKGDARFVKRTQARLADALPLILRQDAQGQIVADWQRFERILDAEAQDARDLAAQAKRLKDIEAAAKANAQKAKPVPPTATTTGKPTGVTTTTKPTTKAEFDDYIEQLAAGNI